MTWLSVWKLNHEGKCQCRNAERLLKYFSLPPHLMLKLQIEYNWLTHGKENLSDTFKYILQNIMPWVKLIENKNYISALLGKQGEYTFWTNWLTWNPNFTIWELVMLIKKCIFYLKYSNQ